MYLLLIKNKVKKEKMYLLLLVFMFVVGVAIWYVQNSCGGQGMGGSGAGGAGAMGIGAVGNFAVLEISDDGSVSSPAANAAAEQQARYA